MNKKSWIRMILLGFLSISTAMMFSSCGGGGDDDESDEEIASEIAAEEEVVVVEDEGVAEEEVVVEEEIVEEEAEEPTDAISGLWTGTRSIAYGTTDININVTPYGDTEFSGAYQDMVGYEGTINGQINSDGSNIMFDLTITAFSPGDIWTFDGSLSEDGTTITGIMDVNGNDNDIVLTR